MQVPVIDQAGPINSNVQVAQVNPGAYGNLGQALAQVGAGVEGFAHRLMDQRNKADASDFNRTSYRDSESDINAHYQKAKTAMANDGRIYQNANGEFVSDVKTAQDMKLPGVEFHEYMKGYASKITSAKMRYAPNELAKEAWGNSADALVFQSHQDAMKDQNKRMNEAYLDKENDANAQVKNRAVTNPDYAKVATDIRTTMALRAPDVGNRVDALTAKQLNDDLIEGSARSVFTTKLAQIQAAKTADQKMFLANDLSDVLAGKGQYKEGTDAFFLQNKLKPSDKQHVYDQLLKHKEIAGMQKVSEVNSFISNIHTAANTDPDLLTPEVFDKAEKMVKSSKFTPTEASQHLATINALKKLTGVAYAQKSTDPAQWKGTDQLVNEIYGRNVENAKAREEATNSINNMRGKILDLRQKEGAEYSKMVTPGINLLEQATYGFDNPAAEKRYVEETTNVQKNAGMDESQIKITTPFKRQEFVSKVNSLKTPTEQAQFLTQFRGVSGPYFHKFMEEMRKDDSLKDKIPSFIEAAAYLPSSGNYRTDISARTAFLELGNKEKQDQIKTAFSANPSLDESKLKEVQQSVDNKLYEMRQAFTGSNDSNQKVADGFRQAVFYKTMDIMVKDSITDSKKATETAYGELLDSNFTVARGPYAQKGVVVPKKVMVDSLDKDGNPKQELVDTARPVAAFLATAKRKTALNGIVDLHVPQDFKEDFTRKWVEDRKNGPYADKERMPTDKEIKEGWENKVANTAYYTTNDAGDGFTLVRKSDSNRRVVPITQVDPKRPDGAPINFTLPQIVKMHASGKLKDPTPFTSAVKGAFTSEVPAAKAEELRQEQAQKQLEADLTAGLTESQMLRYHKGRGFGMSIEKALEHAR